MLSISTSFVSSWESFHGKDLVHLLERLHIDAVELEYRIPSANCNDVKHNLKQAGIKVTSVHNYFPFSKMQPHQRPSGDLFSLADLDPDKRKLALSGTEQTITQANDLEANIVVLHCGWVEMDHQCQEMKQYLNQNQLQSQAYQSLRQQKLMQLEKKKEKHLSGLMFSLEKLARTAEQQGVKLGLENRFHYYELPTPSDFELIFKAFQGAPLGYWHDTGHSHALEKFCFIEQGFLLKKYGKYLIGSHLHDAVGIEDHLAPGKGEIDLVAVLGQLNKNSTLVMELKPGTDESDIRFGIQHLLPMLAN